MLVYTCRSSEYVVVRFNFTADSNLYYIIIIILL